MLEKNAPTLLIALALASCTTTVGDLNGFAETVDACDPRGTPFEGQDFDLRFIRTDAHLNNKMFAAVQVGAETRVVEAVVVVDGFDDPNLHLLIPELLPGQASNFAFWMDTDFDGVFTEIPDEGGGAIPDHQWLRPICPDGSMTFTHVTPFQDVRGARSDGAIFRFLIPTEIQTNADLFNTFRMSVRATRVEGTGRQTRAYYRWAPYVGATASSPIIPRVVAELPAPRTCEMTADCATFGPSGGACVIPDGETEGSCVAVGPQQVEAVTQFQMGGNALGEPRGPIDTGAEYEIEFIIDADRDNVLGSNEDFVCTYTQTAPPLGVWEFTPDLSVTSAFCDYPDGFNPLTFSL